MKALVQDFKCSPSIKNNKGLKPAYLAVDKENLCIVKYLMNCERSSEEDSTSHYSTASGEEPEEVNAMSSGKQAICGSGSLCTEQEEGHSEVCIGLHGGNELEGEQFGRGEEVDNDRISLSSSIIIIIQISFIDCGTLCMHLV